MLSFFLSSSDFGWCCLQTSQRNNEGKFLSDWSYCDSVMLCSKRDVFLFFFSILPIFINAAVHFFQLLWTKDLKMNTVHVSDLCSAVWHVCLHGKAREVYNVVDPGDTSKFFCLSKY